MPGSTNAYVWENVPAARHIRNLTLRNFMDYNVVDEVPDTTCSICNKKLNTQSKEECIVGKCKHSFHRSCAKTWIQEQKKCPFCNVKWNYQMISPKDNNGKKSSRDNNNKNDKKKEEEAMGATILLLFYLFPRLFLVTQRYLVCDYKDPTICPGYLRRDEAKR